MLQIENHQLTDLTQCRVHQLYCPKNREPLLSADTLVLHYTASGNAMSTAQYLIRGDVDSSAHLIIGRDGRILQLVPFNLQSWHAGISAHLQRRHLNRYSIGIELQNAGQLHRRNGKYYAWFNKQYPVEEVYTHHLEGRESYWHRYTPVQLETLDAVVRQLCHHYPIRYILRHSEITTRKSDPGPAFPDRWLEGWQPLLKR